MGFIEYQVSRIEYPLDQKKNEDQRHESHGHKNGASVAGPPAGQTRENANPEPLAGR
jgi:hypothetical protein